MAARVRPAEFYRGHAGSLGSVDHRDIARRLRVQPVPLHVREAIAARRASVTAYRAERKLQKLSEKLNRPPKIRDAANEPTETIQIDQREFNQILARYASSLDDFEYDRFCKIVSAYLQHLPGSAEAYHAAIRAIDAKRRMR